jgi:Ca-activated chloride channel family protein
MSFIWPWALLLLVLVPVLVWLYRRALRPPAKAVAIHPDLELIATAGASGRRWPRHVPAGLYLGACAFALLAVARPTLPVPEAHPQAAIVLALDSSWSMRANDIEPSRFEAAKEAVRSFLAGVPRNTRVGLVTFGHFANVVSPPTDDHELLLQAVDLLALQRGTAIGEALLASVDALPDLTERQAVGDPRELATVILLSDGQNRSGIHPLLALDDVRSQQVTVHTIGVGTADSSDGTGRIGRVFRFDETTLKRIAQETGGRYVFVESADDLREVYSGLGRSLTWRMAPEEATALASLMAAVLLLMAIGLSEFRRRVF